MGSGSRDGNGRVHTSPGQRGGDGCSGGVGCGRRGDAGNQGASGAATGSGHRRCGGCVGKSSGKHALGTATGVAAAAAEVGVPVVTVQAEPQREAEAVEVGDACANRLMSTRRGWLQKWKLLRKTWGHL